MREFAIIFNGIMVRATLDGYKTMTRRSINRLLGIGRISGFQPSDTGGYDWAFRDHRGQWNEITHARLHETCPYGGPGDRLWCKETYRPSIAHNHGRGECECADVNVEYQSDGEIRFYRDSYIDEHGPGWRIPLAAQRGSYIPPIHMPRWASRLILEVVSVRVELLQEISVEDAIAEGVDRIAGNFDDGPAYCDYAMRDLREKAKWLRDPVLSFRSLWDSINAVREPKQNQRRSSNSEQIDRSLPEPEASRWDANPLVWVVEFRRID